MHQHTICPTQRSRWCTENGTHIVGSTTSLTISSKFFLLLTARFSSLRSHWRSDPAIWWSTHRSLVVPTSAGNKQWLPVRPRNRASPHTGKWKLCVQCAPRIKHCPRLTTQINARCCVRYYNLSAGCYIHRITLHFFAVSRTGFITL